MLLRKLLQFRDADIFIHIDRKGTVTKEQIVSGLEKNIKNIPPHRKNISIPHVEEAENRLRFVPEERTLEIEWGTLSIVLAALELIREARRTSEMTGQNYDYLWLLSGQDYPICDPALIKNRLSSEPRMNYIQIISPGESRYNWYKKRYDLLYPVWIVKNRTAIKILKRIYMIMTGGSSHTFPFFMRKKPFSFTLFFGSQWWTLTAEAAYEILAYSDSNPEIAAYFKNTIIPDECYFQTLFMRGSYRNRVKDNLTYVNWGRNRRSPELLTESDEEKLLTVSDTKCFARKVSLPESAALIEAIEKRQREIEPEKT